MKRCKSSLLSRTMSGLALASCAALSHAQTEEAGPTLDPLVIANLPSALSHHQTATRLTDAVSGTSEQMVAIMVNGDEVGHQTILQTGSTTYLSFDHLYTLTGLIATPSDQTDVNHLSSVYQVTTPLGVAHLTTDDITIHQDARYISLTTLRKLGISAHYSRSDWAVHLNMPWQPEALKNPVITENKTAPKIDAYPSKLGMLGLNLDSTYSRSSNSYHRNATQADKQITEQLYTNIGAFGYALGGMWGANANTHTQNNTYTDAHTSPPSKWQTSDNLWQDQFDELRVDNLYWQTTGKNIATRLGTSLSGLASFGTEQYSGITLGYSNQDIRRHLNYANNHSKSLLQGRLNNVQSIKGVGIAGGMAQLRINGMPIAQVQIALDGRYEFLNLNAELFDYRTALVEIALYDYPQASSPSHIKRINLTNRRANVATEELLIEANIGQAGNFLYTNKQTQPHDSSPNALGSIYAEYGLNNHLAIRSGVSHHEDTRWQIGANYAANQYHNLDIAYQHAPAVNTFLGNWQYQRNQWLINYLYDHQKYASSDSLIDSQNPAKNTITNQRHSLLANYTPNSHNSVSLGHYINKHGHATVHPSSQQYSTLNINSRLAERLQAGASWSGANNYYSYRLINQSKDYRSYYGIIGDKYYDGITLQHRLNDRSSFGNSIKRWRAQPAQDTHVGTVSLQGFYRHTFSPQQQLTLDYELFKGKPGWQVQWQFFNHNALRLTAGFQHNYLGDAMMGSMVNPQTAIFGIDASDISTLRRQNYGYLKLSFNLWQPPASRLRLGRHPIQQQGGIVANINHPAHPTIDSESLSFSLNGRQVQASLISENPTSSQYLLNNIPADIHQLQLDGKYLPFEYQISQLPTRVVKVANLTPTLVNFNLSPSYGVAGVLSNQQSKVVVNLFNLTQSESEEPIASVPTDAQGFFQFLGVPSGQYRLTAEGYITQSLSITDGYVMGLNLQVKQ